MVLLSIFFLAGLLLALRFHGSSRHAQRTGALRAQLDMARVPIKSPRIDFSDLAGLPLPVQRYFRTALRDGQDVVVAARIQHRGTFNMADGQDRWKPFSSEQRVITQRPGFDWSARIAMLPGVPVYVHDAYVAGIGVLHASVLGLFTVADMHGGGAIAEGELMRFLAEAAWYPTTLLPSQGVRWEPVDDSSARATLADGELCVTLLFTFRTRLDRYGQRVGKRPHRRGPDCSDAVAGPILELCGARRHAGAVVGRGVMDAAGRRPTLLARRSSTVAL